MTHLLLLCNVFASVERFVPNVFGDELQKYLDSKIYHSLPTQSGIFRRRRFGATYSVLDFSAPGVTALNAQLYTAERLSLFLESQWA